MDEIVWEDEDSGYVVDMNFVLHEVEEGEVSHFY
jgi:hypothetical protein